MKSARADVGLILKNVDVAWVSKPAVGMITVCPSLTSLRSGVVSRLVNADGTLASTPVPANQVDNPAKGWVIANKDPGAGTSTVLSVFGVEKFAMVTRSSTPPGA
jgi:hypothetical protein